MTVATRSGYAVFQPRARLLKLIGAELISDDVVAVTELVKNGHDADAQQVTVEFHGVSGPDGCIAIRDDGWGMDVETLLQHWMQPAGTSKSNDSSRVTPSRRRVLGEKGVGRFAADKLGRRLELVSRRKGDANEVWASFDWDEFDSDSRMLSEISSRWEVRPATLIQDQGTVLKISGLRSLWTERMFRRLSTRLSRLRSPFREFHDFRIRIESDEFPEYAGELNVDFLDRAPYQIDASFDVGQRLSVKIDGREIVEQPWNGTEDLRCGPVRVRLFAFDLETDALAKIGPVMEIRGWLREWSGVSVYRDGFRVWPYGEPHDDWLRLDQRRVNNPVVRLSNNQIVGFVEIGRDRNPELVDQTNREGLVHNAAFEDLRRLMYLILQILEAERHLRRHPAERGPGEAPSGTSLHAGPVYEALEKLAGRTGSSMSRELTRLASRLRADAQVQEQRHRRLLESFGELVALEHLARAAAIHLRDIRDRLESEREALRETAHASVRATLATHERRLTATLERALRGHRVASDREQSGRHSIANGIMSVGFAAVTPLILAQTTNSLEPLRAEIVRRIVDPVEALFADAGAGLTALQRQIATLVPGGRLSTGRKRTIDVAEELHALQALLLPYMSAEGIGLEVAASRRALLRVEMRPESLHGLLHSLIANSVEWTRGRKNPRIRLTARAAGGNCELLFADNGPGISPGLAARVFEPLFSTKENGRGMGLTVVKDIVERHGGRIEILTDRRRRGLSIRIRLPRKRVRAAHSEPKQIR